MRHVKPRFSFHHLKFDPPFLPLSCQKWGRSLMPVRIPWTQKTSKVEEGENKPGLSTSTPFSPAVASTSSSTTTREEDLMNTWGIGKLGGGRRSVYGEVFLRTCASAWIKCVGYLKLWFLIQWRIATKTKDLTVAAEWTCHCGWTKWSHASTLEDSFGMERWWMKAVDVGHLGCLRL